ncbi:serine/threonine-protein kinase [Ferrimonas balearica]|uniref:serine/threonine-protein kinase n=1 Tax=Ferrimonas balearica TaxID=44012 RepID=UPI001C990FDA|nr:serine/threonine-protein kinase [Ferrimonas balearica]MBY5920495.1 protein kinase [Ferrimonas balearica]MBY5996820.1 protein kinase [Ferrimonas balearica]
MAKPDNLRSLFERAMNLPEPARTRWIASLDDDTRAELEALLEHVDEGRDYFRGVTQVLFGEQEQDPFTDDPLELLGKTIAGYTVTELLGQGGMGVVYKGYDPKLARSVAIKLLAPGQHLSDAARDRFLNEAQLISRLDHPNIGTVYGHAQTDQGLDALIMAFYDGNTLADRIESSTVDGESIVSIGQAVLEGLRYAHSEGVIHKDIKPANLMVLPGGQVKILDFGAAAYLEQEQEDTAVPIGTTAYMSPEQIRGEPLTGATDLWSLGVVLFEAAISLGWLDRVNAFTWAQNPSASAKRAPEAIEQMLLALLVVDPERRLEAVAALDLTELDRAARQIKVSLTGKTARTVALTSVLIAVAAFAWQTLKPAPLALPEHRKLALVYDLSDGLDTALAGELTERLKLLAYEQGNISFIGEYGYQQEGGAVGLEPTGANLTWNLSVSDDSDNPALEDDVKVSLSLLDTLTGEPLSHWQQRYPKARMDLVPTDLYQQILSALQVQPAGLASLQNQESITDPRSYSLYLDAKAKMARYQQSGDTDDSPLLEEAKQSLLEAHNLSPRASYQLALAQVYTKQYEMQERPQQISDAIYWANKALETNPQLIPAYLALAELYGLKGEYGTAIASYRLALQQQPSNIEALQGLALIYREAMRFSEAEEALQKAVVLEPNNWRSHSLLGTVDHFQGKLDDAANHYHDSLLLYPNNRLVQSNLAVLYINKKRYSEVLDIYSKVEEDELDGYERLNLALAHFYLKDYVEAERYYALTAEKLTDNHSVWFQLGLSRLLAHGDEEGAKESFENALKVAQRMLSEKPNDILLIVNLASTYSWLGKHDDAILTIERAYELWTNNQKKSDAYELSALFSTLIVVYEKSGRRTEALNWLALGMDNGYKPQDLQALPILDAFKKDVRFQQIAFSDERDN